MITQLHQRAEVESIFADAINTAIVAHREKRYRDAECEFRLIAARLEHEGDDLDRVKTHCGLGNALERIAETEGLDEYFDKAILEYQASLIYLETLNDPVRTGIVENNIGYLLFRRGRCTEAHRHLQHAERLLEKDTICLAQSYETRARIFIKQGLYRRAVKYASLSVLGLIDGIELSPLDEAVETLDTAIELFKRG
jgi:tetratricopeptide (TPR) repeat protein